MILFLGLESATWQLIGIGVAIVGALVTAAWWIAKFEEDNEAADFDNDVRNKLN